MRDVVMYGHFCPVEKIQHLLFCLFTKSTDCFVHTLCPCAVPYAVTLTSACFCSPSRGSGPLEMFVPSALYSKSAYPLLGATDLPHT